jgi:uncharacterized membrane protein YoaK (UPF0700 family)
MKAANVPLGAQTPRSGAPRSFSFALLAAAGWADAVGFLMFAQLYVSFMSGDATQLGVTAGDGKLGPAAKLLIAQAVFVLGALLGRQLRLSTPDYSRRILLAVNAVLLALVALLGNGILAVPAFAVAVLAMGAQNTILHTAAGVPVGSMVTGTLARLGENICDRMNGRPAPIVENFGQWASFVLAALAGTFAYRLAGAAAFLVPALINAFLVWPASRLPDWDPQPKTNDL